MLRRPDLLPSSAPRAVRIGMQLGRGRFEGANALCLRVRGRVVVRLLLLLLDRGRQHLQGNGRCFLLLAGEK